MDSNSNFSLSMKSVKSPDVYIGEEKTLVFFMQTGYPKHILSTVFQHLVSSLEKKAKAIVVHNLALIRIASASASAT